MGDTENTGFVEPIELDVNMTFEDMYRFNLYHIYHNSQGVLSIVLAVALACISILTWGDVNVAYNVIYLVAAVLLLFYVPLNLRGKVKKQMKTNEAWQHPIHYTFDENGVTTSVADQHATIPWNQLYKLVSTKRMVLIYGGRIRANVVPRDQMGDAYDRLYEMAKERMDSYRFKMKKQE